MWSIKFSAVTLSRIYCKKDFHNGKRIMSFQILLHICESDKQYFIIIPLFSFLPCKQHHCHPINFSHFLFPHCFLEMDFISLKRDTNLVDFTMLIMICTTIIINLPLPCFFSALKMFRKVLLFFGLNKSLELEFKTEFETL